MLLFRINYFRIYIENKKLLPRYKYRTLKEARAAKTIAPRSSLELPPTIAKILRYITIYFFLTTPFIVVNDSCAIFREVNYTKVNQVIVWLKEHVMFFEQFFTSMRYLFFYFIDSSEICEWYKRD